MQCWLYFGIIFVFNYGEFAIIKNGQGGVYGSDGGGEFYGIDKEGNYFNVPMLMDEDDIVLLGTDNELLLDRINALWK